MNTNLIETDTKIKDCPFCGSESILEYTTKLGRKVSCTSCQANMQGKVIRMSTDWLENKLIESWNDRAN